jgi:hypothetical protein
MTTDVASELARGVPELDRDWQTIGTDLDLPYVALGGLAGRMVELDRSNPRPDWQPLFSDIERRLRHTDGPTREHLIVGFLEGLQNVTGNRGGDPTIWSPFLGARTREAWSALNDLWQQKMSPEAWREFLGSEIHRH